MNLTRVAVDAARMARPDLLRCVNGLACCIQDWTEKCDRDLYRLVCYIKTTLKWRQVGWCGDHPKDWVLELYADADFAGCKKTNRSTSGVYLKVAGPST